jgi:hypothetical protein
MSILRVANVQFNASGTRRIDYDATADDGIIKISADAIKLPVGDTASRPNSQAGMIRYNSDLGLFEGANSTAWGSIGGVVDFATANGWANSVGVSANSYADAVGAAANSYASTMDTAGNNYTNAVGLAGNNYTNAAFTKANTALQNTSGTFAGALSVVGNISSTGANNWFLPMTSVLDNGVSGISWYQPTPTSYGIYRSSGDWSAPNYQQLYMNFDTGIVINGGTAFGKSGIVLQPNGGSVGIGTSSPSYKLHLANGNMAITSSTGAGALSITDDSDSGRGLLLKSNHSGTGNTYIGTNSSIKNLIFGIDSIERMRLDTSGNFTTTGTITSSSRGITKASMPSGSILQIQQTVLSSTFTTAATTYTDLTGMSVSITPTSATSKILVTVSLCFIGDASTQGYCRLMRGSTPIAVGDAAGSRIQFTLNNYVLQQNEVRTSSIMFLDSPATTSATTYKLQLRNQGGGTVYVNRSVTWAADATSGAGISTITVMEIAV